MDAELARCLDAFQQNWGKNKKEKGMSKKNYSVLESSDLAENYLQKSGNTKLRINLRSKVTDLPSGYWEEILCILQKKRKINDI